MEATDGGHSRLSGLSLLHAAMIQRRIPRIRSTIKRALSQDNDTIQRGPFSRHSSLSSNSPPPSYRTDDSETAEEATFPAFEHDMASSRPSSSGSSTPAIREEAASGVRWRYATPGFQVLRLAEAEALAMGDNPNFIRSQYINGTACILQGLPANLSAAEKLTLQEAMAEGLAREEPSHQRMVLRSESVAQKRRGVALQQQSALHRCVACVILQLFLLASFILPYLQHFLRQAYQFDRRHRISDRVLAHSVTAADKMGRSTMVIASRICAMNDGQVGELMKDMGVYIVQGFGGGIYDGIGESMLAFGIRADGRLNDNDSTRVL